MLSIRFVPIIISCSKTNEIIGIFINGHFTVAGVTVVLGGVLYSLIIGLVGWLCFAVYPSFTLFLSHADFKELDC